MNTVRKSLPVLCALACCSAMVACGSSNDSAKSDTTAKAESASEKKPTPATKTAGATKSSSETAKGEDSAASGSPVVKDDQVTVTNCGKKKTYPSPVERLFVNDGNIISITLAAGARKNITAVSSLGRDKALLELKYGKDAEGLKAVAPKYPSLENVVAAKPQVMFAGWNYGFTESKGLTPALLKDKNIDSYILSESCRSGDGKKRGTMDPWKAVVTDITNIGAMTGNSEVAEKAAKDIEDRRKKLEAAPKADKTPVVFVFDSAKEEIFTSGFYGAPEAMITTAGAKNATTDVKDTWTRVSWERLATAKPDVIAFVDYPPQAFEQKVELLEKNPASKNLEAVKEKRFVNLPYAMWTSGPMNIDGAELLRAALEHYKLQPKSDIKPTLELNKLDIKGNAWLTPN